MTHGLVLGKFMPPTQGHVDLVRFAGEFCGDVSVVVGSLPTEPIPGELRVRWVKELFPTCSVLHLTEELPSDPSEHPDFWPLWRASLLALLPSPPTHVFAGEDYGARLATELGAVFVPMDRTSGPSAGVNATAIRKDPALHWDQLPGPCRPYFQKRVHIVGPESSGKTTLAAKLAEQFGTLWVPEYARTWLERAGNATQDDVRPVAPEDMPIIARGHRASAEALAPGAGPILFLDTDALTTVLWSRELFGAVDDQVLALADAEAPALTLLTSPDLDWQPDSVRYRQGQGTRHYEWLESELDRRSRPWVRIAGRGDQRWRSAVAAITERL